MKMLDRAAQFSPFAALTGFDPSEKSVAEDTSASEDFDPWE